MSQNLSEREVRIQKSNRLREFGVVPYAQRFDKKNMIQDIVTRYGKNVWANNSLPDVDSLIWIDRDNILSHEHLTISAWRLTLLRAHGSLTFAKLMDESGEIQLMFHKKHCHINVTESGVVKETLSEVKNWNWDAMSAYKLIDKLIDVWDFIWVEWVVFYTNKGELTIFVSAFTFLAKAIRPLWDKFHWVAWQEAAYRQRYLDMIHNRDTLERMKLRSKFIKTLREFYHSHGFTEIETPMLNNAASWTAAQPFITHHNDFWVDLFLRIAIEIHQKMATVGMLEKTFEIGKEFRNEWSSPTHLQEFTWLEHYAAYWNYEDNMKFTEQMFDYLFEHIPELSRVVKVEDKQWVVSDVDFSTPWNRLDYVEQVKKDSWIDVSIYTAEDEEALRTLIKEKWFDRQWLEIQSTATMIDYLYKKVTRPKITGPAFIMNYPKTMQPLARVSDTNDNLVEQFQLVVNGWEVLKAYGELVDPIMQQSNFDEQAWALERGDDEATAADDEFVEAMEYWMPPQSWFGMWIDRIIALLTEQKNIRDCILFPLMKPEHGESTGKAKETMLAVAVLNKWANLLPRQEMNTIAHLNAAFWARGWKKLFLQDSLTTWDEKSIKLNIQHAIMIKQTESNEQIKTLIQKAKDQHLEISEFIREMIETSDDEVIVKDILDKKHEDVEHLWVLIYGKKSVIEKLTDWCPLYSWNTTMQQDVIADGEWSYDDYPSIETAEKLADKHLSDTRNHCQQVGNVMKWFAQKLNLSEDEQKRRYVSWLLHDLDRDACGKDGTVHMGEMFVEMMDEIDAPAILINDIRSHYTEKTWIAVDSDIRKYLISIDELSWLINAYSLMRPNGFEAMKRKSLNKKIKDKKFAAWVDRDHVKYCEKYLDIPLNEFALEVSLALFETS